MKTIFLIIIGISSLVSGNFSRDNDVVTDSRTNLQWQDTVSGSMSWVNTIGYCENLNLNSQSDWRVPNLNELTSLSDNTSFNPAINNIFRSVNSFSYYWSSTTRVDSHSRAMVVDFYYGGQSHRGKSDSEYVLCVRAGK